MSEFNLLKEYPDLLDLVSLSENERHHDLQSIFKRDIEDNPDFKFRGMPIYPIKIDGEADMGRLFKHLTCKEIMCDDNNGKPYPKRVFDIDRSRRLHWINHHIKEKTPENITIFTLNEKRSNKQKVKRTYIYDKEEEYVIVLEHLRTGGLYLLTAYFLNEEYGKKAIEKKMRKSTAYNL